MQLLGAWIGNARMVSEHSTNSDCSRVLDLSAKRSQIQLSIEVLTILSTRFIDRQVAGECLVLGGSRRLWKHRARGYNFSVSSFKSKGLIRTKRILTIYRLVSMGEF